MCGVFGPAGAAADAAAAGDDMDASDHEQDDAAAGGGAGSSARQAAGQNAGLYNEIGQHNPKKAKAGVCAAGCTEKDAGLMVLSAAACLCTPCSRL